MEKKFTGKNQIDLYYYPNLHTHSFCLSLYIKAGALYEEEENNGITHFLEHILFRNINHLMDGNMYREIDKMGLYFNGATYKEFMQLYIIGAPKHFQQALDILVKAFEKITLPVEVLETEKQRVKAEIREADEFKTLDYFAGTCVWENSPLARTIAGTRGTVNKFTRKKMEDYRSSVFTADNLFFYVTGNVSETDIEKAVEKTGVLPVGTECLSRKNHAAVPEHFRQRKENVFIKNSKDTIVQFSFDFDRTRYTYGELTVLYDILFSGENSLIHQELSEKRGLIYSYTSVMEKYNNIGRIFFAYEIKPKDLYLSVQLVREALLNIGSDLEERLSTVLPEYTDNAYMVYDDNEDFNWMRAYENHIMDEKSLSIDETTEGFLKINKENIERMAGEIFQKENLVVTLKGDKHKTDIERIRELL